MTEIPKPASPLPWKHDPSDPRHVVAANGDYVANNSRGGTDWDWIEMGNDNMAYIAWAANNAPALAARCARLEKALEDIEQVTRELAASERGWMDNGDFAGVPNYELAERGEAAAVAARAALKEQP